MLNGLRRDVNERLHARSGFNDNQGRAAFVKLQNSGKDLTQMDQTCPGPSV